MAETQTSAPNNLIESNAEKVDTEHDKDTLSKCGLDKNEVSNNDEDKSNESSATAEEPSLSKNQLRKRKRQERLAAKREQRKRQEKEAKRVKAIAAGRDLEKERQEQLEREKSGEGKKKRDEIQMKRMATVKTSFGVCFDCSFEKEMTPKEIGSLAKQVRYAYAVNKRSDNPCQIFVSSLHGMTRDLMEKVCGFPDQWEKWAFQCSDKDLLQMLPDKSNLVYLTSDSENEIEHLDDSKIYIIGGIVDRNRLKRAAIEKAESLGLQTAKLPISSYLKLVTTKVLTCNHVFEILLKYREHGNNWEKAMLDVLPQRKNATTANSEALQDKDENETEKESK